ncbi:MAG: M56 family metallopeptidase, partial [Hyphomicrobiales bacterium]|nr:M56 family metallopeptidase [Hyphomicrobiales bacterium]
MAVLVPCFLVATGWAIPVSSPQGPVHAVGEAGQNLLEITATVGRVVNPPDWDGETWVPVLILSIFAAGLMVHLLKTMRGVGGLLQLLRNAQPNSDFRSNWPVLVTAAKVTPFAVGGRRPSIVLPDLMVRDWPIERVTMVIRHEEAHLRHRDPDIAFVLSLVVALFWFNPFVRDLVARWRNSCELRADGTALRGATASTRKSYAVTLLDA